MNDTLKMYGSIGSEIMNRYFVVAMCFKSQPRWRRLQTTYISMTASTIFYGPINLNGLWFTTHTSPKVHWFEGSLDRMFTSPKVY